MEPVEKLKSFLETQRYQRKEHPDFNPENGHYPFITISRETGAGGNSAAAAILEEFNKQNDSLFLGWQKFNQELCLKVAEDPELKKFSIQHHFSKEYLSQAEDLLNQHFVGSAPQDKVNHKIFRLMESLAAYGKVILVGRGGVCLTRHYPLGLHLRLVAPLPVRVEKIAELFQKTTEKAKAYVLERDRAREEFLRAYFNRDIHDPHLYDAVFNTSGISLEVIAKSVVEMLRQKAGLLTRT